MMEVDAWTGGEGSIRACINSRGEEAEPQCMSGYLVRGGRGWLATGGAREDGAWPEGSKQIQRMAVTVF
jgi:hypothetical protein